MSIISPSCTPPLPVPPPPFYISGSTSGVFIVFRTWNIVFNRDNEELRVVISISATSQHNDLLVKLICVHKEIKVSERLFHVLVLSPGHYAIDRSLVKALVHNLFQSDHFLWAGFSKTLMSFWCRCYGTRRYKHCVQDSNMIIGHSFLMWQM